jgi:hypothetical protein
VEEHAILFFDPAVLTYVPSLCQSALLCSLVCVSPHCLARTFNQWWPCSRDTNSNTRIRGPNIQQQLDQTSLQTAFAYMDFLTNCIWCWRRAWFAFRFLVVDPGVSMVSSVGGRLEERVLDDFDITSDSFRMGFHVVLLNFITMLASKSNLSGHES